MAEIKDTNPKDAIGSRKLPVMSVIPSVAVAEEALALLDGSCKYARHNYRIAGVRASVYYDAAMRHLTAWWEGQDFAEDSGVHHLGHARACLAILLDALDQQMLNDDRPPPMKHAADWQAAMNARTAQIIDRYPEPKEPFTRLSASQKD